MGAIEVERLSQRLSPRPMTKITRDLWSQALIESLSDPLNLPMRHDWVAVHANCFAPIAGGQIDSTVCQRMAWVVGSACCKLLRELCPKD